ncbi:uncharacterized protein LOC142558106 [Dermacentor variabilis]|uniref:uncharacterized protein LOC142558106 n=1 Tax=Dermacentor variabilis TaxID=34621 RepID=UPI003F5B1C0A
MGKAKKSKSGGKAKKGKSGAKGKKGSKGSSSAKKGAAAKPSKEPSSSQQQSKGSEQTSASQSATPSQTDTSATSFKPLDRPPLEPLVLPADLDLSLPRRPSTIYVWDWGNVWFFPVGVVALAVVVLGMILMSYNIQSEYVHTPNETTAAAHNATSVAVAESTETKAEQVKRRWFNATRRKQREMSREPTDAVSTASNDEWTKASASAESATSAEGAGDGSAALVVQVAGEKANANVTASLEASTPARAWQDAPVDRSQGAFHATNSLPVASKEADSEERPQNASAALGNDP